MSDLLHSLFESCVEVHPEDEILNIFKALPHCKGLLLFADEAFRPILLIISADIRRLAVNRLSEDATVSGRRVKLKEITRFIFCKCTYNDFASSLDYYKAAKALFSNRMADHLDLSPVNFVKINTSAKWPVFTVTHDLSHDNKTKYFGPFPSRKSTAEFIDILENAFALCKKYCLIDDPLKAVSCPYFQMGSCNAPCLGKITRDQYLSQIDDAVCAASGFSSPVAQKFQTVMKDHAANMRFEQAHAVKKQIEFLSQLSKRDFLFVSELSKMNLFHVDIGPKAKQPGKKTKAQLYTPFIVRAGLIYKLPDFVPGQDLNVFDAPPNLSLYLPDADITDQLSLTVFSLFRQSNSGLWLNLSRLGRTEATEQLSAFLNS